MKRKLLILELALTGLLGIYSAAGWVILRGAGAYRTGTTLGLVLAASRPYTSLAAALLLVLNLILLLQALRQRSVRKSSARQEKLTPQKGTAAAEGEETVPMADGESSAEAETLPLSDETVPMGDESAAMEEKPESKAAVPNGETAASHGQETVLMSEESLPQEAPAQMDAPDKSPAPEVVPETGKILPRRKWKTPDAQAAPAAPLKKAEQSAAPTKCKSCGAPLKPGQKFCNQCGTPTENGGERL